EADRQLRVALFASRLGRQGEGKVCRNRQGVRHGKQRGFFTEAAVFRGADDKVDIGGPTGEGLVDIAFAVGNDGDVARRGANLRGAIGTLQPAIAFLLLDRTGALRAALALVAA
ncbi:hypothetical protein, partial [Rhizobium chutanense]